MRPDLFAQARALQRSASPRTTPGSLAARVGSRLATMAVGREDSVSPMQPMPQVLEDMGRFSYRKDRVISEAKDGFKVYEGVLRGGAPVAVKVIPKLALDEYVHSVAAIGKLLKLGSSQEMHFFTRYLETVGGPLSYPFPAFEWV